MATKRRNAGYPVTPAAAGHFLWLKPSGEDRLNQVEREWADYGCQGMAVDLEPAPVRQDVDLPWHEWARETITIGQIHADSPRVLLLKTNRINEIDRYRDVASRQKQLQIGLIGNESRKLLAHAKLKGKFAACGHRTVVLFLLGDCWRE